MNGPNLDELPEEIRRYFEEDKSQLAGPDHAGLIHPPGPTAAQSAGKPASPPHAARHSGGSPLPLSDYERAVLYVKKVPFVSEGARNSTLNALAFRLLQLFHLTEQEHRELCLEWSRLCSPPLEEKETLGTIASAWKGAYRKNQAGAHRTEPKSKSRIAGTCIPSAPAPSAEDARTFVDHTLPARLEALANLKGKGAEWNAAAEKLAEDFGRVRGLLSPIVRSKAEQDLRKALGVGKRDLEKSLRFHNENAEGKPDYQELAKQFLNALGYGEPGKHCRLLYWRQDFYAWTGPRWDLQDDGSFQSTVTRFLQAHPLVGHRVSAQLLNNVLLNLKGLVSIDARIVPPCFLHTQSQESNPFLLSLSNGILDLGAYLEGRKDCFSPHTSEFFNTVAMPYAFKPGATCARYLQYLEEAQPDPTVRDLLQEWMGYQLVPITRMQRFMLITGEGGNGKSVFLGSLRAFIGEENFSPVSLEAFCSERTFGLAPTIGKLANLQFDLGYIESREEGKLKSFVSGEPLIIERKGKDPLTIIPTARLTFAANLRPSFNDKSKGLWRRMLYVTFDAEIPEEKQVKGMDNPKYWASLGELEGIFLWAVEGLKRLLARGRFEEPKHCIEAKEEYRDELDSAVQFFKDHCQEDPRMAGLREVPEENLPTGLARVWTMELYKAYEKYHSNNGYSPKYRLAKINLGKRLLRHFKFVRLSRNPRTNLATERREYHSQELIEPAKRDRQWIGLTFLPQGLDESPTKQEAQDHAG